MKIVLEGREYEFIANGSLMKVYQDKFSENLIQAMYKVTVERDPYVCAKIIYSGIEEADDFDKWLGSFESPLFTLDCMDTLIEYLTRATTPTVESKQTTNEIKKKKI